MNLFNPIVCCFWAFAGMFLYCESGERVTTRFDDIKSNIYQCDWHSFRIEVQKIMPLLMQSAQQPVFIAGFGNITFTRETFKKVFTLNI